MAAKIIHISDVHYKKDSEENHGTVLKSLFRDIAEQKDTSPKDTFYVILSGDIVRAADDTDSYTDFLSVCCAAFEELGIPQSNRLCVPGNHDISRKSILDSMLDHEGVVSQNPDETTLNDYLRKCNGVFTEKFTGYIEFESKFSAQPTSSSSIIWGNSYNFGEDIGVYCLNSALFSSGGLTDKDGKTLIDKNRLVVPTRTLYSWIDQCNAPCKILVMHHPLDWLAEWASKELWSLLVRNFALLLTGHTHDQEAYHLIINEKPFVQLQSPPLFTDKSDTLGYSIITICPQRYLVSEVVYRQWTPKRLFLPGVNFSGTENGKLNILPQNLTEKTDLGCLYDHVDRYLSDELEDALTAFSSQPRIWVDPIISEKPEIDRQANEKTQCKVSELVSSNKSTVIQAPAQFGLSSLARYLAQQAWRASPPSRWVYLDSRQLKPTRNNILKAITRDLNHTGQQEADLGCIILDSWMASDKNAVRILKTVCETFYDIPVFVMQTLDGETPISPVDDETIGRTFRVYHLWSLSREHVRAVVASYNDVRHIGDEDIVTARIVNDIDTINLHRTPLNCLTVLKASEADFDENPVNRTDILHRVLFILFNADEVPRYKVRPDMKDCEHVLGYFVEILIRNDNYTFSLEFFLETVRNYCKEQVIAIDADLLFDIIFKARILVPFGSDYCFKFTSWLFYFAAHRMHHDMDFSDFILSGMRYSRFPEVMEFYTGIDRQRENAVHVLTKDVLNIVAAVKKKCGLPEHLNPLSFLEWQASPETIEKMQAELRYGVAESNLPAVIKDRYADRDYDRSRPYSQTIREIFTEHSMACLMLLLSAASRGLRNSDYVNPTDRQKLLLAIMEGWRQVSQVLLVLLPPLAEQGHASFDGARFVLADNFGDAPDERFCNVLAAIPANVVRWYQDHLYSPKMAPLLGRLLDQETDDLIRHEMILLQIAKRPNGWKEKVQSYIFSNHKRSFYLNDVNIMLREQYMYAFVNEQDLRNLKYLIKMVTVKHIHGVKRPKNKVVGKMPDSVLPKRADFSSCEIEKKEI